MVSSSCKERKMRNTIRGVKRMKALKTSGKQSKVPYASKMYFCRIRIGCEDNYRKKGVKGKVL